MSLIQQFFQQYILCNYCSQPIEKELNQLFCSYNCQYTFIIKNVNDKNEHQKLICDLNLKAKQQYGKDFQLKMLENPQCQTHFGGQIENKDFIQENQQKIQQIIVQKKENIGQQTQYYYVKHDILPLTDKFIIQVQRFLQQKDQQGKETILSQIIQN